MTPFYNRHKATLTRGGGGRLPGTVHPLLASLVNQHQLPLRMCSHARSRAQKRAERFRSSAVSSATLHIDNSIFLARSSPHTLIRIYCSADQLKRPATMLKATVVLLLDAVIAYLADDVRAMDPHNFHMGFGKRHDPLSMQFGTCNCLLPEYNYAYRLWPTSTNGCE